MSCTYVFFLNFSTTLLFISIDYKIISKVHKHWRKEISQKHKTNYFNITRVNHKIRKTYFNIKLTLFKIVIGNLKTEHTLIFLDKNV